MNEVPASLPPTGSVSLVFTDVQGSTALWERVPDSMRVALATHDRVMREAIARNSGYEVKTEGDAFMVAFKNSIDALRFCLDAQNALLTAEWPPEILAVEVAAEAPQRKGLRVRMGVHAGEPDCRSDPNTGRMDYFGPAVNRAARVSSAGHGGQVLVSEPAWKEIQPRLAELGALAIIDLGEHRLKDLESADRLFQVLPATLAARTFPPIKTLDAKKTNLQTHATAFVGRESDLAALHELFSKGERLVTLMGPGGTGKTRLSIRYAGVHLDDFTRNGGGGAWFCDLTEARTIDGICGAVGAALNVPLTTGKTSADTVAQLGHAIAGRGRVLLVLDNFEQVIAFAPETVGVWFKSAPQACFLISSQERLRLPGEAHYELKPLTLPEGSDVRSSEAVQLFVERARAVRPGWTLSDADAPAVAEIVKELDGIPLAIELAAARIGVLPPAKILERLPRRFELLGGARRDATSRQATLRGAIDWSWNLLKPHEQDALAQASVFHGGFSLEAAEEIVDLSAHEGSPWTLDVIESLRDKSLLRAWEPRDFPGELRFGMYSNIRQYAQEKLDADKAKADAIKARHAAHYLRVGAEWAEGVELAGGLEKLRRLALETENLVTVFHRAKVVSPATPESASNAIRAMLAVDPVLSTRGPFGVHLAWLDDAIAHAAPVEVEPILRARILETRGRARRIRGRMDEARADFNDAIALAQSSSSPGVESRVLGQLGLLDLQRGLIDDGRAQLERGLSLAGIAKDRMAAAHISGFLGGAYGELGRPSEARRSFDQALRIYRELGNRPAEGRTLSNFGLILHRAGNLPEAVSSLRLALEIHRETGDRRFEGNALGMLANVLVEESHHSEARSCFEGAIAIQREVGNLRAEAIFRGNLAILDQLENRLDAARAGFRAAVEGLRGSADARLASLYLGYLGASLAALGDVAAASGTFDEAAASLASVGDKGIEIVVEILRGALDLARSKNAASPDEVKALRRSAQTRMLRHRVGSDADTTARAISDSEDVRLALRIVEALLGEKPATHAPGKS